MKSLSIIFLLILPFQLVAHLGTLSGKITEKENKNPLIGATVSIVGQSKNTISNELGQFQFFNLEAGNYKIQVSNIGYKTLTTNIMIKNDETNYVQIQLENSQIELEEIEITTFKSNEQELIGKIDTKLRTINSSQDFLRTVPGLFIGQHAGGGKAEQIFLRGFDIDHGTDIQITTDGIPVNMPSHAHGQGYADMHFIIPELVNQVNFKKGLYQAAKGNFATAGFVELNTKTIIDKNEIKVEAGQFNSHRFLGIFNLLNKKAKANNQSLYIASEYNFSDGYFENPQRFNRINAVAKYHGHINKNSILTASLSTFSSQWNASGQIPERAVKSGLIGFYGAIDPNEGGQTSRTNFNLQTSTNTAKNWLIKNQIFYSNYQFKLFSNFTFFLNDSLNGDQIKQYEKRNLMGYNGSITGYKQLGNINFTSILGIQLRKDATDNTELSRTKNRIETLESLKLGNINELNAAIYLDENIQLSEKLLLNLGLRYDYFNHKYYDLLQKSHLQASSGILSPKLNISYTFNNRSQAYLNTGRGFHSNDTRVVIAKNSLETLPAALGADFGLVLKPFKRLIFKPAIWVLRLNQEFVYVGDEGVVEPSGRTLRYGIDLSTRYQIFEKLYLDIDYNTTKPRAVGLAEGENYIPLAPLASSTFGLSYTNKIGLSASIRGRYLGNRPANESNTIVAKGYLVNDLLLNFTQKKYTIGLTIQNMFNTKWKETQFATESRLKNELAPVEEIHFTPGTPFFAKVNFSIFF